jgi:TrmH family RNA methyltransferase
LAEFRIVLVETEYGLNLGYAARAMKNFGFGELRLVSPKAEIGEDAVKYSKHARDVLESARAFPSVEEATADCDFVVGMSGSPVRSRETLRTPTSLRRFVAQAAGREGVFGVLFGREGTGLSTQELKKCDFIVSIPANPEYPVLNLTHALAIALYEFSGEGKLKRFRRGVPHASKADKERLLYLFGEMADRAGKGMRNPERGKLAFRRVLGRAMLSDVEAGALLGLFSRMAPKAGARGKPGKTGKRKK